MSRARFWLEQVSRRIGGPRVLALPLLRTLAVLAGFVWVLLVPADVRGWGPVQRVLLAFFLYSVALMAALWRWPRRVLRLNRFVLAVDLTFALLLIAFTGGTRSTLFLALLLIAGLQSYYYGVGRGLAVALAAVAAYLVVVWPTIDQIEWANTVIRLVMLIGTAVGVGILAHVEESERKDAKERWLQVLEASYLRDLLDRHDGNISAAAKAAGIDRKTFHRLINKYQLR